MAIWLLRGAFLLGKRKNDPASAESKAGQDSAGDREARRAAALRANLRKRKTQKRARADEAGGGDK